jgi:hypothetical protein
MRLISNPIEKPKGKKTKKQYIKTQKRMQEKQRNSGRRSSKA